MTGCAGGAGGCTGTTKLLRASLRVIDRQHRLRFDLRRAAQLRHRLGRGRQGFRRLNLLFFKLR